jgi:hypothetical protein
MKINKCLHLTINNIDFEKEKIDTDIFHFRRGIFLDKETSYGDVEKKLKQLTQTFCEQGESNFDNKIHKKYYRYPNINLSRDKMDNCKQKYGMAKVLNKDKADFSIIGQKMIEKTVEQHWRMSLSSLRSIHSFIDKSDSTLYIDGAKDNLTANIKELMEKHGEEYPITVNSNNYYRYHNDKPNSAEVWLEEFRKITTSASYLNTVKEQHIDTFEEIMNSNTGMLVSDVFMNNLASEDSHVLTGKDYKNIRALLKSTNKEDKAVGMSIMSNCNIQKSKTYLALLFFHFSETLRGEPMWNQVAFKSLRREFDKYCLEYNHYHSNRYSQCVQYLAEDGALTVNAAEHLITIMFDNVINQSTGINSDNNMFILDKASVKLAPVAKAKVKNDVDLSQIALDMQSDLPF